jgi:hypothetical protein
MTSMSLSEAETHPKWWPRFAAKFTVDDAGCWVWTGEKVQGGYGRFSIGGRKFLSHRVAYMARVGPIPTGLDLDHLCRNRACANPAHLEPVTRSENMKRGQNIGAAGRAASLARRAAQTHCRKGGHPLSGENLHVDGRGFRSCRICIREYQRAYYQRKVRAAA